MKTIFIILIAILAIVPCTIAQKNDTSILFDFNSKETSGNWYIVNDDVMGGISRSEINVQDDAYVNFKGVVSPENNGGFASVRAKIDIGSEKNYKGVIIRARGDGNKYSLRFRTNTNFDGYAYQAKFQSEKDSWVEYKIPFSDFEPTFRGRTLSNKPKLESENIEQIGILIADYQFGPFSLDIDWIKLY